MYEQPTQNIQTENEPQNPSGKTWRILMFILLGILIISSVAYGSYYFSLKRFESRFQESKFNQNDELATLPTLSSLSPSPSISPSSSISPSPSSSISPSPSIMSNTRELDICKDQPTLIRLSFKSNDGANQVFISQKGSSLERITSAEWEKKGYKWECVNKYFLEELPKEILSQLPMSDLLSMSKINISSWKTYNNTNLGFRFRYPSEWSDVWQVSIYGDKGLVYSLLLPNNYIGPLTIHVNESLRNGDWAIDKIERINVAGKESFLVTSSRNNYFDGETGTTFKTFCYFIDRNLKDAKIYLEYCDSYNREKEANVNDYLNDIKEQQSIFATILSTFEFLK